MNVTEAERVRDHFHAQGNRFGMMARLHENESRFKLGPDAAYHIALADKWKLGQFMAYSAASAIADVAGISEYGRAWVERLMPDELKALWKAESAT